MPIYTMRCTAPECGKEFDIRVPKFLESGVTVAEICCPECGHAGMLRSETIYATPCKWNTKLGR